jgi:TP901 family phage tail tape measure protein
MPIASQLVARVSDEGAEATANKMRAVGASVDETAGKIRAFALGAAAIGVATLVGIGIASVKMAGDFQSSMTSLVTGAGESASNIKLVSDGILGMAGPVGTTTSQLAAGMYLIESSGQHGAKALQTLRDAAMGAKVGSADLGIVADGVTTIMTDYAAANISSAQATNTLIATVASGKTHMSDLAASLAEILPTASAAGVGLTDISAGMATLTASGVPASQAATYLRQTILALNAPTDQARSALEAVGLTTDDVSAAMKKSLPDALAMITDAIGKKFPAGSADYINAMKDIVGGTDQLQGVLGLTGDHMQTFRDNVTNITKSVKDGGSSITGWAAVQQDFNFKMERAREVVEVLGIKIGTALLPALGLLMDGFSSPTFQSFANQLAGGLTTALLGVINGVTTLVNVGSNLVNFFQRNQVALTALQVGITTASGAILGLLVFAFQAWAASAIAAAIPTLALLWPFLAIGAGIALLVVGIVLLVQHWNQLVSAIPTPILKAVQQIFQQIGAFLVSVFVPVWQQLVSVFQSQLVPAWQQLVTALQPALPAFQLIGAIILGVIVVAFGILLGVLVGLIAGLAGIVVGLIRVFGGIVQVISGALQIILGIIGFFADLFTGKWSKLGADLGIIWQGILTMLSGVLNIIAGLFQAVWGFISGLIGGFVSTVIAYFTSLWHALVGGSIIPDMINGIISWFAQLPGRVISFVVSLVASAISWFINLHVQAVNLAIQLVSGFVNQVAQLPGRAASAISSIAGTIGGVLQGVINSALNWGASIVNNVAQGIRNAIGAVGSAIGAVTDFIASHLPHSPAKIGPLRYLAEQGEEITGQISKGMLAGMPQLHSTLSDLVAPISMSVTPGALPATTYAVPPQFSVTSQPQIVVNLPDIILDGQRLTRAQMPYITNNIRLHTGAKI